MAEPASRQNQFTDTGLQALDFSEDLRRRYAPSAAGSIGAPGEVGRNAAAFAALRQNSTHVAVKSINHGDLTGPFFPTGQVKRPLTPEDALQKENALVFVNGINNSSEDHCRSAQHLADAEQRVVIGVYNRSDAGQAVLDDLEMPNNPAVEQVVRLIDLQPSLHIVGHSDGSLVTAEALWEAKRRNMNIGGTTIDLIGSQVVNAPPGPRYLRVIDMNDWAAIGPGTFFEAMHGYGLIWRTVRSQSVEQANMLDSTQLLWQGGGHGADHYMNALEQTRAVHAQATSGWERDTLTQGYLLFGTVGMAIPWLDHDVVEPGIESVGGKLRGMGRTALTKAAHFAHRVGKISRQTLHTAQRWGKFAGERIAAGARFAWNQSKNLVQNTGRRIAAGTRSAWNHSKNWIDQTGHRAADSARFAWNKSKLRLRKTGHNLAEAAHSGWNWGKTHAQKTGRWLSDKAGAAERYGVQQGKNALHWAGSTAQSAGRTAWGWGTSAASWLGTQAHALRDTFSPAPIGASAQAGLFSGAGASGSYSAIKSAFPSAAGRTERPTWNAFSGRTGPESAATWQGTSSSPAEGRFRHLEDDSYGPIQRQNRNIAGSHSENLPHALLSSALGAGTLLPRSLRSALGNVLGFDPGMARIHHTAETAKTARALNAEAFTLGRDVFFGSGMFRPQTGEGVELLAHELAHVGQQMGHIGSRSRFFSPHGGEAMEREAQNLGAWAHGRIASRSHLHIGVYSKRYQMEEDRDLRPTDQDRLDRLAGVALEAARRDLPAEVTATNLNLATIQVDLTLDIEAMSDAEIIGQWAGALVNAIVAAASRAHKPRMAETMTGSVSSTRLQPPAEAPPSFSEDEWELPERPFLFSGMLSAFLPQRLQRSSRSGAHDGLDPTNSAQYERMKADLATQEIQAGTPTGSALKTDDYHTAPSRAVKDIPSTGRHFSIRGNDGKPYGLTQMDGFRKGKPGVYEWIVDSKGNLTHQRFIKRGQVSGFPNQKVVNGRPVERLPNTPTLAQLEKEGTRAEAPVVEAAEKLAAKMDWSGRMQGVFRYGGHVLIVVAIAGDAYQIYKAKDHVKAAVSSLGGWAGASAASAAFAAWWAPADVIGPWAWAVHGAGTLISGGIGYWAGSEATRTIYELVLEP